MDGYVVIGTEVNTKNFDAQIDYIQNKMQDIEDKLKQADMGFEVGDTFKLEAEYERLGNQLLSLKQKQNDVINANWSKATLETERTNLNLFNMVKKLSQIGLAIFGIRTAYTGVRQVMNGVLSQNEGLQRQMEGIRNSLFNAFTPVVEKIINLIKTLMAYINYVWQQLFGKVLFVDKAMQNTNKNLASGAKSAKEIKNQLAGFDEANVLSDNKSSSGGIGGISNTDTTASLGFANIKIPDWLIRVTDWIKKNPTWAKILAGLGAFTILGGWKKASGLASFISSLIGKKGNKDGVGGTGLLGLKNLLTLAAIVWTIKIAWDGFDLFGVHIAGIKEFTTELKSTMSVQKSRNETLDASIKKDKEFVEQSKQVLSSDKSTNEERKTAIKLLNLVTKSEADFAERSSIGIQNQLKHAGAVFENAKEIDGLYRSGKLTKEEQYEYYKMLKDQLNPTMEKTTGWVFGQTEESKKLKKSFEQLDKKYKTQYEIEMKQTGSNAVQTAISKIQTSLNNLFNKKQTLSVSVIIDNMKSAVSKVFHANGGIGIVNMPGRGVSADYIGERGREGYIPMDNVSQMSLLGQEIAKYVRINNYISNYMDARQINTLLKESENKSQLASNG